MQSGKRKREVSSCIPCHTRKQKCDRQYPCNRCSRRRRPELCAYYSFHSQAPTLTAASEKGQDDDAQVGGDRWEQDNDGEPDDSSSAGAETPRKRSGSSSLAEAFGYDGRSKYNTMALVRKLVPEDDGPESKDTAIPNEIEAQVRKTLDAMHSRHIVDFLVRYFVIEVNWIDQLIYPPWFLGQYQRWWRQYRVSTVAEIEFLVLILRICCYASQFLPSPSCTIDSVKGVPLADIRKSCEDIIDALGPICTRLDPRGSLIRVQHIAYAGLSAASVGRMDRFWESVSCASRVAQQIGLHLDTAVSASSLDEIEKEMRRRTFCNLYIWDSYLSRHLDRMPFLSDTLNPDNMPRMRLAPENISDMDSDVPDVFAERTLRARLAQFWRCHSPSRGSEYDAIAAEERYEEFCSTFLPSIPPAFALDPDKQWDERLPTLPMQRQLLHIAVFELLCRNFRPTLLQQADHVGRLPHYKQILIAHGKRALAAAALNLLQCVSTLHKLMGGAHTRFAGIIVPTFEAAVPLLCLCADQSFPGDMIQGIGPPHDVGENANPLGARLSKVTRQECMQAARDALSSLETLSEVSDMAEAGARTLARLISRVDSLPIFGDAGGGPAPGDMVLSSSQGGGPWSFEPVREYLTVGGDGDISPDDFSFGNNTCLDVGSNWETLLGDMSDSFGMEEIDFTKGGHMPSIGD